MIDYALILQTNYAGAEWSITGNDYDTLEWFSASTKPTQAELDAQWPAVQTQLAQAVTDKALARQAVLDRLGITADEAALLLS